MLTFELALKALVKKFISGCYVVFIMAVIEELFDSMAVGLL